MPTRWFATTGTFNNSSVASAFVLGMSGDGGPVMYSGDTAEWTVNVSTLVEPEPKFLVEEREGKDENDLVGRFPFM